MYTPALTATMCRTSHKNTSLCWSWQPVGSELEGEKKQQQFSQTRINSEFLGLLSRRLEEIGQAWRNSF